MQYIARSGVQAAAAFVVRSSSNSLSSFSFSSSLPPSSKKACLGNPGSAAMIVFGLPPRPAPPRLPWPRMRKSHHKGPHPCSCERMTRSICVAASTRASRLQLRLAVL
eukprot:3255616-Pyramimonas_sp.AAC.1